MFIDQKDSTLHLAWPVLSTDSRQLVSNSLTDSKLHLKIQRIFKKRTELEDCADFRARLKAEVC